MRRILIAIAIGATALAAAACGPASRSAGTDVGATQAPLESTTPLESMDPLASPTDEMLPSESPASS